MTESHATYDELVTIQSRIEAMFAELLALTQPTADPGSHVVRYVCIEAATFAEFVERLNAAHTEIVAAGDEYTIARHAPLVEGQSWGALLAVVRSGPRPKAAPKPTRAVYGSER